ncbi:MAG: hypothetical protein QQN45_07305 [Nitrosopumilus sp.]
MSKTISIRLSSELIQRIDEKCVTDRCCRNDFVKKAIEDALGSVPEIKVTKVSYDDWTDIVIFIGIIGLVAFGIWKLRRRRKMKK